jgi:hypothetical protein
MDWYSPRRGLNTVLKRMVVIMTATTALMPPAWMGVNSAEGTVKVAAETLLVEAVVLVVEGFEHVSQTGQPAVGEGVGSGGGIQ